MTTFSADTFYNRYLPANTEAVDAIISVTGSAIEAPTTSAAEIIIVDISGSMGGRTRKLKAAQVATAAAIDCLRDGVLFGVIAGNEYGIPVYPESPTLIEATTETRAAAKAAVNGLRAGGGTAIGQWLLAARNWFPEAPAQMIRHAILLTDGQNNNETPAELDDALDRCEGQFQCDCRGVGTDWKVEELHEIGSRLLGTVDIIREPADLAADFEAMIERSMGKGTGDVALRVWTPVGASVVFVKQVYDELHDLTNRRSDVSELVGDYPTGAWGNETRDYHVRFAFPARDVGDEMLAGRVSLVVGDDVVSQALVSVSWTDDLNLSTKVVRELDQYVAQEQGVDAIREGLEALESGDFDTATQKLARAREIAMDNHNYDRVQEIEKLLDPHTGAARMNPDAGDLMAVATRSVKTARVRS